MLVNFQFGVPCLNILVYRPIIFFFKKCSFGLCSFSEKATPSQLPLLKSIVAGPTRPPTSPEQTHKAHTHQPRGCPTPEAERRTWLPLLPDLILVPWVMCQHPLFMQGVVCLPITAQRPPALAGNGRVLPGIWLTPDSRVYFYHPSGKIGPLKQRVRESNDPVQESEVHCTASFPPFPPTLPLSVLFHLDYRQSNRERHSGVWGEGLADINHTQQGPSCGLKRQSKRIESQRIMLIWFTLLGFFLSGLV